LEKHWVTHAGAPKRILEQQESDSCLTKQTTGARKTGSFATLKYQENDSLNKQSEAQRTLILVPPSKVIEFQQSCVHVALEKDWVVHTDTQTNFRIPRK